MYHGGVNKAAGKKGGGWGKREKKKGKRGKKAMTKCMTTQGQTRTRTRRPDDVGIALYWLLNRTKISAINILWKDYVAAILAPPHCQS